MRVEVGMFAEIIGQISFYFRRSTLVKAGCGMRGACCTLAGGTQAKKGARTGIYARTGPLFSAVCFSSEKRPPHPLPLVLALTGSAIIEYRDSGERFPQRRAICPARDGVCVRVIHRFCTIVGFTFAG